MEKYIKKKTMFLLIIALFLLALPSVFPIGFTSGTESGTVIFESQILPSQKTQCEEQENIYYNNLCYNCTGVLVEDSENNILCKTCKEGYVFDEDKNCLFDINSQLNRVLQWEFVDKILNKIILNNPLLALIIIVVVIISIVGIVKNKELIKRKWLKR